MDYNKTMRTLDKNCEYRQGVIGRRIKKIREGRATLEVCASLITKAGYPISVSKLSHVEAGMTPLQGWAFLAAFCKAMVKKPGDIIY